MTHRRYEDGLRINPLVYAPHTGTHRHNDTPEHDGYHFGHHQVTPRTNNYEDRDNNDPNIRN